jgi:oxygen-dependent protoporphyrinogen oxidase
MSRTCVVVGAGPAGLSAAYRLSNSGIRVTVLEASPHIGGRTRSEKVGDVIVNTGATFVASFFDATLGLIRELQLETVVPRPQATAVATPFGKLPLVLGSRRAALRFPLVSWSGKLRTLLLFARLTLGRRNHLADLAGLARLDGRVDIERWGRRKLGDAGYEYLLRTGIESFFYFEANQASVALAKSMVQHAMKWHMLALKGGAGTLCEALARRLEVRTGCRVGAVEVGSRSLAVHHSGGTVEADSAVLALPANQAAHLEGSLPPEDQKDLRTVRYMPHVALFFGYERPITVQYPLVAPAGPGRHPIGGVATVSRWMPDYVPEGKDLVCIYASAWRSAELMERDPDKIVAAMRADAEEIFGRLADPDWIRMYPREHGVVVPAPGHYRRMQMFQRRQRERIFFAGDWLTGPSIEGAVRTGLRAAEQILRQAK